MRSEHCALGIEHCPGRITYCAVLRPVRPAGTLPNKAGGAMRIARSRNVFRPSIQPTGKQRSDPELALPAY